MRLVDSYRIYERLSILRKLQILIRNILGSIPLICITGFSFGIAYEFWLGSSNDEVKNQLFYHVLPIKRGEDVYLRVRQGERVFEYDVTTNELKPGALFKESPINASLKALAATPSNSILGYILTMYAGYTLNLQDIIGREVQLGDEKLNFKRAGIRRFLRVAATLTGVPIGMLVAKQLKIQFKDVEINVDDKTNTQWRRLEEALIKQSFVTLKSSPSLNLDPDNSYQNLCKLLEHCVKKHPELVELDLLQKKTPEELMYSVITRSSKAIDQDVLEVAISELTSDDIDAALFKVMMNLSNTAIYDYQKEVESFFALLLVILLVLVLLFYIAQQFLLSKNVS